MGILPPAEVPGVESSAEGAPELAERWRPGSRRTPSVIAELEAAKVECQRYVESGIAAKVDPDLLRHRFPSGHLNKLGVILKVRRDGVKKTRLIVDMRR